MVKKKKKNILKTKKEKGGRVNFRGHHNPLTHTHTHTQIHTLTHKYTHRETHTLIQTLTHNLRELPVNVKI